MHINAKVMTINNTNYSCHTTAVEFLNQSYGAHIMPYHSTSYKCDNFSLFIVHGQPLANY